MSLSTVHVTYDDRDLTVRGEYCRGYDADFTDPGSPEAFDVFRVTEAGVDITDTLSPAALDGIAAEALDAYLDGAAADRAGYYDCLREERALGVH